MPNFRSLASLEVPEKFVWGGLQSQFHVKPNRCVEVRVRVGVLTIFSHYKSVYVTNQSKVLQARKLQ